MTALNVLIVDDEQPARSKLKRLLGAIDHVNILGEADSGLTALTAIEALKPDVVFLDIQMPDLDGLSVAKEVGDNDGLRIVFVTAYDQHAIEAFELNAVDYLLKPFDKDRLNRTVDKLKRLSDTCASEPRSIQKAIEKVEEQLPVTDRILVKSGEKYHLVSVDDVDWVEAVGNYADLHVGSTHYLIRQTMSSLTERLDSTRFLRIHRSAIVNINKIKELQPLFKGDFLLLLATGKELKLSRNYRDAFFKRFEKRLG